MKPTPSLLKPSHSRMVLLFVTFSFNLIIGPSTSIGLRNTLQMLREQAKNVLFPKSSGLMSSVLQKQNFLKSKISIFCFLEFNSTIRAG